MKKLTVLSMIAAAVLLTACGDSATGAEAKAATSEKTEMKCQAGKCGEGKCGGDKKSATSEAKDAVANAAEKVKAAAAEKATEAVDSAKEAADAVKAKATEAVDTAKEAATSAADTVKAKATEAVDSAKAAVSSAVASVASAADTGAGKALFAKCVSCHGADGKTAALGKSAIIAGQSAADLEKKITEYKAGTRNVATMGALMKGQVAEYSDADIKAVSAYISGL